MTVLIGADAKLECNTNPAFVVSIVQIARTLDFS